MYSSEYMADGQLSLIIENLEKFLHITYSVGKGFKSCIVISEWMEDAKIAIEPLRPIQGNPLVDIENVGKYLQITCRGSNEPNGLRGCN